MECFASVTSLARALLPDTGRIQLLGTEARTASSTSSAGPVDILALGSGWTWSFLGPSAGQQGLKTACTTRDGRDGTVPFLFDPESDDTSAFASLPDAKTIVIIFPLYSAEAAERIVHGYVSTRQCQQRQMSSSSALYTEKFESATDGVSQKPRFLLLGSTGIWNNGPTLHFAPLHPNTRNGCYISTSSNSHTDKETSPWTDRHAPVDMVPRAKGEEALLAFNKSHGEGIAESSVLCLSGLWGHGRSPRRYVGRLAPNKEQLSKLTSVHLVHGHDVARAILAMHDKWHAAKGQRWLLTNERVYDLWDLISQWGDKGEEGRDHFPEGPQLKWIQELMAESRQKGKHAKSNAQAIRSLPRSVEQLGFALDGTDFWNTFELYPEVPWAD